MEALLQQTNQGLYQLNHEMETLLRCKNMELPAETETGIKRHIEEIYANCNKLNEHVFKQPVEKRMTTKLKVDQIFYDVRHIESSFKSFQNKKRKMADEERRREELLNTKFTTNAETNDTMIAMDYALDHNNALHSVDQNIDQMLFTGNAALDQMRNQRMSLKGVRKRLLDIGNTLGLSNTVMRMIDKRGTQDKWIVYGGMVVTCFIMFLSVKYLM